MAVEFCQMFFLHQIRYTFFFFLLSVDMADSIDWFSVDFLLKQGNWVFEHHIYVVMYVVEINSPGKRWWCVSFLAAGTSSHKLGDCSHRSVVLFRSGARRSGCGQATLPRSLAGSSRGSFLPPGPGAPGIPGLWPHHPYLCLLSHGFSCVFASSLLSLIRTPVIAFRGHLNPGWFHFKVLNWIIPAKTCSQIRSISHVPSIRRWAYLFWGAPSFPW